MFTIAIWMVFVSGSPNSPPAGSPSVIFVPASMMNWVSLPEPAFACSLIGDDVFVDMLGHTFTAQDFQRLVSQPDTPFVRVFVDRNSLSFARTCSIFRRLRKGININVTIFVVLAWVEYTSGRIQGHCKQFLTTPGGRTATSRGERTSEVLEFATRRKSASFLDWFRRWRIGPSFTATETGASGRNGQRGLKSVSNSPQGASRLARRGSSTTGRRGRTMQG